MEFFKKVIYEHLKIKYNNISIDGHYNQGNAKILVIDESLFIHDEKNQQIKILGESKLKIRKLSQ